MGIPGAVCERVCAGRRFIGVVEERVILCLAKSMILTTGRSVNKLEELDGNVTEKYLLSTAMDDSKSHKAGGVRFHRFKPFPIPIR